MPSPPPKPQEFSSGDRVRVQLEMEVFKMMQEGHGGWNDQMTEVNELIFVIFHFDHLFHFITKAGLWVASGTPMAVRLYT